MYAKDGLPYAPENRALWGIRLLVAEKIGVNLGGYVPIGPIQSPDLSQGIEYYKHYFSPIGQDKIDLIVPIKAEPVFKFTTDDVSNRNLKLFLNGDTPQTIAANPTATFGPELFVAGKAGDVHGLTESRMTDAQRTALKVYDVTGTALLVSGTDYNVIKILDDTYIQMIVGTYAGHIIRIGTDATASTPYGFTQAAAISFAPLSKQLRECAVKIQFYPVVGKGGEWRVNRATITNGSKLGADKKQASTLDFELNLLDDSAANPTKPFGTWYDFGYDDAGTPTI